MYCYIRPTLMCSRPKSSVTTSDSEKMHFKMMLWKTSVHPGSNRGHHDEQSVGKGFDTNVTSVRNDKGRRRVVPYLELVGVCVYVCVCVCVCVCVRERSPRPRLSPTVSSGTLI